MPFCIVVNSCLDGLLGSSDGLLQGFLLALKRLNPLLCSHEIVTCGDMGFERPVARTSLIDPHPVCRNSLTAIISAYVIPAHSA
jgi:hypothetical protein